MSQLALYLIPCICFLGGFMSTVAGMGGGLLIMACTSMLLPISVVVPLNGMIILAGQITRVLQFHRHIEWRITIPFIPGSIIGAAAGTLIYFNLPEGVLAFMLGCVMLWFAWVPASDRSKALAAHIPQPWFWVGIIHTFLSTVSGAGGLFQSLMVNSRMAKEGVVATIAGTLLFMAIFKTAGYYFAGFDYSPYLLVIGLSWVMGIIGTTVGRYSLNVLPDSFFRRLIRGVVTLFSLRLFWQASQIWLAS